MMNFRTFLCVLMAIGSGYFLYTKKHETMVINNEIKQTVQEINLTKERVARLRAKWVLENQPDKLKKLTRRFTPYLRNTTPDQYVSIKALNNKLPPIQINSFNNINIQKKKNINELKEVP